MMKIKQDKGSWEKQYDSGAWDWLASSKEFARYSIVAAYVQMQKRPTSLLDLGCGDGVFLRHLDRNLITEYTGMDLAQSALDRIEPRLPADRFICSSLEAYIPTQKWDVILFNEVLYYLHNPVEVLEKFETSLNPGGFIVISMHQKSNPFCTNNRCFNNVLRYLKETGAEMIDQVEIDNGARWNVLVYRPPILRGKKQ